MSGRECARVRGRRLSALSAGVLATALLGGCSTDGAEAGQADGDATGSTTSPARPTQEAVLQDATICAAFNDVLTIVENADLAVRDGRMAGQEQQGWYRLATRVLDRLPSSGEGAVHRAIAELQAVAPAVALGAGTEPVGIRSAEWYSAEEAVAEACQDVGVELTIGVFTGG